MSHRLTGVTPNGTPYDIPGFHFIGGSTGTGPGTWLSEMQGQFAGQDLTISDAPAPGPIWIPGWETMAQADWGLGGQTFFADASGSYAGTGGPHPTWGDTGDMYTAPGVSSAAEFLTGLTEMVPVIGTNVPYIPPWPDFPSFTPQFDWLQDMTKLGVLGLGALAIIMVAK